MLRQEMRPQDQALGQRRSVTASPTMIAWPHQALLLLLRLCFSSNPALARPWIIGCVFPTASFPLPFPGSCTCGCIPPTFHRVLTHTWPFPLLLAMIPAGKLRQPPGSAGTSQQHRCDYSLNRHLSRFQTGFIPSPWGMLGAAGLGIAEEKRFLFP